MVSSQIYINVRKANILSIMPAVCNILQENIEFLYKVYAIIIYYVSKLFRHNMGLEIEASFFLFSTLNYPLL